MNALTLYVINLVTCDSGVTSDTIINLKQVIISIQSH